MFQSKGTFLTYFPQQSIHKERLCLSHCFYLEEAGEGKEELETDLVDLNLTVYLCLQSVTLVNFISDIEQFNM